MTSVDARIMRSRTALLSSVSALAQQKPLEDVSVDEVCQASGVSRATFYRHSQSACLLLWEELYEQLRAVRQVFFTEIRAITDATTRDADDSRRTPDTTIRSHTAHKTHPTNTHAATDATTNANTDATTHPATHSTTSTLLDRYRDPINRCCVGFSRVFTKHRTIFRLSFCNEPSQLRSLCHVFFTEFFTKLCERMDLANDPAFAVTYSSEERNPKYLTAAVRQTLVARRAVGLTIGSIEAWLINPGLPMTCLTRLLANTFATLPTLVAEGGAACHDLSAGSEPK